MTRRIRIEHPNGERYAVEPKAYHELYEPKGFVATVYDGDGGEPYVAPAKRGKTAEQSADKGE